MKTTKSPERVLKVGLAVGLRALPLYLHACSPKTYTQPQLFACLVFKEFMQLDYRKLSAVLEDAANWTALIGLKKVPHFTAFQKAAQRLLRVPKARQLMEATIPLCAPEKPGPNTANFPSEPSPTTFCFCGFSGFSKEQLPTPYGDVIRPANGCVIKWTITRRCASWMIILSRTNVW